jgi:hypothetical protein
MTSFRAFARIFILCHPSWAETEFDRKVGEGADGWRQPGEGPVLRLVPILMER